VRTSNHTKAALVSGLQRKLWIQFQGATDNEFLHVRVIFRMIPPTIPDPGVREQTASWNNFTVLVAAYWNRGVQYSFIKIE